MESAVNHLGGARRVQSTLLAILAGHVVPPEVGIVWLLRDDGRLDWMGQRRNGGFAGVDAHGELALSDEMCGGLLWDDLDVVRATGVGDIDGWGRPRMKDDGPLFCLMATCWASLSQS